MEGIHPKNLQIVVTSPPGFASSRQWISPPGHYMMGFYVFRNQQKKLILPSVIEDIILQDILLIFITAYILHDFDEGYACQEIYYPQVLQLSLLVHLLGVCLKYLPHYWILCGT